MRERANIERIGNRTLEQYWESIGMPERMRRELLSGVNSGATKQKTPNLNKARAQFTEAIARDALMPRATS